MNGLILAINTTDKAAIGVLAVVVIAWFVLVGQIKKGGKMPPWRKPKDKK